MYPQNLTLTLHETRVSGYISKWAFSVIPCLFGKELGLLQASLGFPEVRRG